MKRIIPVALIGLGLVLAGCRSTDRQQRWEYKSASSASNAVPEELILQGWKPFGHSISSDGRTEFHLKRRKPFAIQSTESRTDYLRATLPFDAAVAVMAAKRIRKENPESKQIVFFEEVIVQHFLRMYVCLNDPRIPDSAKRYARNVWPKLVAYAAEYRVFDAFQAGRQYQMLDDDIVLPDQMPIRDVFEEAAERLSKK